MRTTLLFSRIVQVVALASCLVILICGSLLTSTESAGVDPNKNTTPISEPVPQSSPHVVGEWVTASTFPTIVAIHMHLLPNGKVFIFQDDNATFPTRQAGSTFAYVWDVNTGTQTQVNNTSKNVFCSGHSFLPDGRLLITGGHDGADNKGIPETFIFDSTNNTWTQMSQQMDYGRWYPSVLTLSNGEIVVVAGSILPTNPVTSNDTPEVWQTNSGGGWRDLSNATFHLPTYPYMHLAPDGKVFVTGPWGTSRFLDTAGSGAWSSTTHERVGGERFNGASVMYEPGKVVMMGGHQGCTVKSSAEIINLNDTSPEWTANGVGSMANARIQLNATILPDGKVLVTGGTNSCSEAAGAIMAAEMWNPATKNFTPMASMAKKRLYHSTAMLLPDGRVLSAGGGRPPGPEFPDLHNTNAEIYSPPYLFTSSGAAVRPTIDSHLSKGVRPGQTIFVTTPEASSITDVTLIALSSVTHTVNMGQRFNRLSFTQGMGGLNVTMPANSNLCPPGVYMLFVLNSNGVPSVARLINVNSSNALPPGAPSNLVATATSTSSVSVSWSAGTGSIDHYEVQRSTSVNGPFTTLPNTTSTSITDSSLSSTTTYIYRVRAVDAQGNYSDFSNTDIATTIVFTDDPLTIGVTIVQAQHVNELRQAVNAVRAAAGLSASTWTDSPLSVAVTEVKAVHISELRSSVNAARTVLGLTNNSYTDPTLTPTVTLIKAIHAHELRDRVK